MEMRQTENGSVPRQYDLIYPQNVYISSQKKVCTRLGTDPKGYVWSYKGQPVWMTRRRQSWQTISHPLTRVVPRITYSSLMVPLASPVTIHLKIKILLFIVISQWPYLYLTLTFSVSFDNLH